MDDTFPVDAEFSDPAETTLDVVHDTLVEFLDTADVTRVYGQPVSHQDTLIIPAAEVVSVLAFGTGYGAGSEADGDNGGGGGGGGGGKTLSRPVAVIIASPDGVRVEPVVDTTKVILAALTAAGFIAATLLGFMSPKKALKQLKGE